MHDTIYTQLEDNGYVLLEDFLSEPECDELVEAAKELAEDLPNKHQRVIFVSGDDANKHLKEEYFMTSNDKMRLFFEESALDSDGEFKVAPELSVNKIGHALHCLHPIFRCYTYSERVKSICRELAYREPSVVQSMFIFKNPGVGSNVLPHQDITYLHSAPRAPVGFWIALEDATIENGCLWIARGSHQSGVHRRLLRIEQDDGSEVTEYDKPNPTYLESSFTPIPVTKGTCILLHGNVIHKSSANTSENGRPAYVFHVVEMADNIYSPDNWLQEGANAPFTNLYSTPQIMN